MVFELQAQSTKHRPESLGEVGRGLRKERTIYEEAPGESWRIVVHQIPSCSFLSSLQAQTKTLSFFSTRNAIAI